MPPNFRIIKLNPEQYKQLEHFSIIYGIAETKFGECIVGLHKDSICFMSFFDGPYMGNQELGRVFPKATLFRNDDLVKERLMKVLEENSDEDIKLYLKGTDFQITVWEQLINLPSGSTTCYENIAKAIGRPKAVRAVANAIGKNNIGYLVPCHRVISKNGALNKYKWGPQRKLKILRIESAM